MNTSLLRKASFQLHRRFFGTAIPTLVGKAAPNFTAKAVYPDNSIKQLTLSNFAKDGKYVCLFFWPYDFTFVCPSEILAFNHAKPLFDERNVELIGASADSEFVHQAWKRTPLNDGGIGDIDFPIISDSDRSISSQYGILTDQSVPLRGLFLIDKNCIIRHSLVNDLPLGRSVEEALRMVDALQHNENYGEVCPANWKKGSKAMKATQESVSNYLSSLQG